MVVVYYKSSRGASIGKYFHTAERLESFISRLRKPATIKNNAGELIGRVVKDGKQWHWIYDPAVFTPNTACTGLSGTVATESNVEQPASQ